jgi:capsular exopolysaccharide synthesis family protein
MSRLSDALDRAATTPLPTPANSALLSGAAVTGPEVPWDFERTAPPAATAPDVDTMRPGQKDAAPSYRFGAPLLDKVVISDTCERGLVEQYRRLAAVFHHAQVQQGIRSVMVASALASEGKTLTATNLALTFSHSYGKRVLLIDADLRRPGLHNVFGFEAPVGLRDCLRSGMLDPLPLRQLSENLWILPAGRPDPDPMSGLVSDTMKQLLTRVTEQFDWVVVDTPPVALMADANLLAAMIDAALLVVSASSTPYPLARRAVEAIGPSRVIGAVLNRVKKDVLVGEYDNYGYYGYYGKEEARGR